MSSNKKVITLHTLDLISTLRPGLASYDHRLKYFSGYFIVSRRQEYISSIGDIERLIRMEYFFHSLSNSMTSLGLVEYWYRASRSNYRLLDPRYSQVVNRVEGVIGAKEINFI